MTMKFISSIHHFGLKFRENSTTIETVTSTYDIMPALCNLFDINLNGHLITGRDALSDKEGLIVS